MEAYKDLVVPINKIIEILIVYHKNTIFLSYLFSLLLIYFTAELISF